MPNWAYNSMTVRSVSDSKQTAIHDLQQFLDFIRVTDKDTGEVRYDLTKAHPMPEVLVGTESPTPSSPEPHPNWAVMLAEGKMTQEWHDELVAKQVARYEAGQKALAETGYTDWYEWSNKEWGVKWPPRFEHDDPTLNADGDIPFIEAYYESPWSPADELMEKVSARFPNLVFTIEVTEEADLYAGVSQFHGGEGWALYYSFDDKELPKSITDEYKHLLEQDNADEFDWEEYTVKMDEIRGNILSYANMMLPRFVKEGAV